MDWARFQQKQPTAAKILMNSFRRDEVAHAYLFEGNKGTGKRETASLFAKSYFCSEADDIEPCNRCRDCRRIDSGNHPDVHVIVPDGSSIKIWQIRALIKEFSYRGVESQRKIYIVHQADKMTPQAANSLLKFLEEPNAMTCAILVTDQVQQILSTILSRCQTVSFAPPPPEEVEAGLQAVDVPEAVKKTAVRLTHDVEEAEALCADESFAPSRRIVIQLTESLRKQPDEVFLFLQDEWHPLFHNKSLLEGGLDLLLLWYRDVLFVKFGQWENIAYTDERERLDEEASELTEERAAGRITAVLDARRRLDANVNPQSVMEQLVWKLQEGSSRCIM